MLNGSFEHDFVEESIVEQKQPSDKLAEEPLKSKEGRTVWIAKVGHFLIYFIELINVTLHTIDMKLMLLDLHVK